MKKASGRRPAGCACPRTPRTATSRCSETQLQALAKQKTAELQAFFGLIVGPLLGAALLQGLGQPLEEARVLALEKIKQQSQDEPSNGTNGVNGTNGNHVDSNEYDLKIPRKAVVEGTKTVRKELEKVCEITED